MQEAETHPGHSATLREVWTPLCPCKLQDRLPGFIGRAEMGFLPSLQREKDPSSKILLWSPKQVNRDCEVWDNTVTCTVLLEMFHVYVCVCSPTESFMKEPDTSSDSPSAFENRGCFLNYAEKQLYIYHYTFPPAARPKNPLSVL